MQHQSSVPSGSNHLMLPGQRLEFNQPKQYPVSVVGGFSSQQAEEPQTQSAEVSSIGAEEDSDDQLSMTWVAQPGVESFLVSSVTYTDPSPHTCSFTPRQRTASMPNKNSSTAGVGCKGAMSINSLQFTNRAQGSTVLAMAGQRTSSRTNADKVNHHSFQLSSHSMPLIKSERPSMKTNRLGHLLRRKHRITAQNTMSCTSDTHVSTRGVCL